MSVQDEITRIAEGKADLLNAIAEQGVEVTDDTKIEETGAKVREIGNKFYTKTETDGKYAKLNEDNKFTGKNDFTGSLTLPNAPSNPETASVTDTYTSRQTANADTTGLTVVDGSMTTIGEIKGSTVKSENLLPYPYANGSNEVNGVTVTVNKDGTINFNGECTADYWFVLRYHNEGYNLDAGTYTISGNNHGDIVLYFSDRNTGASYFNYTKPVSFTLTEQTPIYVTIKLYKGYTYNNVVIKPMLNKGETALPYERYFSGLKNAEISGIKSIGKNLINVIPIEFNWNKQYIVNNKDGSFSMSAYNTGTLHSLSHYAPSLKAGETYTLSLKTESDAPYIYLYGTKRTWRSGQSLVLTREDLDNNFNFYGQNAYADPPLPAPVKIWDIMIKQGIGESDYEPYTEENYNLPETLNLGKWDSFNPQTGEIVRGTKTIVFDGSEDEGWTLFHTDETYGGTGNRYRFGLSLMSDFAVDYTTAINSVSTPYSSVSAEDTYLMRQGFSINGSIVAVYDEYFATKTAEEFKAHLAELAAEGTPLTISYKLETPTIEKLVNTSVGYTVYDKGTETVIGNENEEYGAIPTITQTYSIHDNPKAAATHEYVQNGLAKKLDKTGGTITGALTVEGGTNTTLPAFAARNNEATYGLALEDDTYKLGKGSVDEEGNFVFDEGEGLPVALRDDSSEFKDGDIVQWQAKNNKFVSGGGLLGIIYNSVYPVGSIYMSDTESNNPQNWKNAPLWTWERIENRYLVAQGTDFDISNGHTGGSNSVTLKTENLPSHSHTINHTHGISVTSMKNSGYQTAGSVGFRNTDAKESLVVGANGITSGNNSYWDTIGYKAVGQSVLVNSAGGGFDINVEHTHNASTSSISTGNSGATGNGKSFDVKPAYYVVYVWKRTA